MDNYEINDKVFLLWRNKKRYKIIGKKFDVNQNKYLYKLQSLDKTNEILYAISNDDISNNRRLK